MNCLYTQLARNRKQHGDHVHAYKKYYVDTAKIHYKQFMTELD